MRITKLEGLEELEDISDYIGEDDFVGSGSSNESSQPKRLTRSRIEILRELIELKDITGQYYDTNIFD